MAKTAMYRTKGGEGRYQVSAPINEADYRFMRLKAFTEETTLAAQVRKAIAEYVARNRPPSSSI